MSSAKSPKSGSSETASKPATVMSAADGKVVAIHYTLRGDDGVIIDTSDGDEPLEYLHGQGGIVPGLEKALAGGAPGHAVKISVPPEEGYGKHNPDGIKHVPLKAFPDDVELEPGMQFFAPGPSGEPIPVWVVGLHGDHVDIDTNHPLAGKTLNFEANIVSVRDATAEEMEHGHAHGAHGHGHDDEDDGHGHGHGHHHH